MSESPPPGAPPSGRPMSPLVAACWALSFGWIEGALLQATEAVRPGALTDLVNFGACEVLAASIVIFAIVRVHAPNASLRAVLGVRPVAPLSVLLSAAAGAGLRPLLSTLDDVVVARWPYAGDEAMEAVEKLVSGATRPTLVGVAFVLVPVVQELFFRGILFGRLRVGTSARGTIAVTSALFACASLDGRRIPSMLVLGLGLAWLRARAASVLAAVAGHVAFWAVEGVPILLGRDTGDVVYKTKWIAGGAAISLLALVTVGAGGQPPRET